MNPTGEVWVVAGAPGAGKTYVSQILSDLLVPPPALLDKDTMFGDLDEIVLEEFGLGTGARESDWYMTKINPGTYAGLVSTAREVRRNGCSVVMTAPFTQPLHDPQSWKQLCSNLGDGTIRLVWVKSDPETLLSRIKQRNHPRDADKLTDFASYTRRVFLERQPSVEHIVIDNRLNAPSVEVQLRNQIAI